mgnify:CR=1 FL=1
MPSVLLSYFAMKWGCYSALYAFTVVNSVSIFYALTVDILKGHKCPYNIMQEGFFSPTKMVLHDPPFCNNKTHNCFLTTLFS